MSSLFCFQYIFTALKQLKHLKQHNYTETQCLGHEYKDKLWVQEVIINTCRKQVAKEQRQKKTVGI